MSSEIATLLCRQLDVVAEAILTPPDQWHNHVCPYCLEQRDCNCASEPDRITSVCDDCLYDPTIKAMEARSNE